MQKADRLRDKIVSVTESGATSLDLSSFDTGRVEDMGGMFGDCSGLTELDLSSFDTGSVEDMEYMFNGCSSLETVYLGDGWTDNAIEYVKYTYPKINFVMK